jgi:hypothetical protein
MMPESMVKSKKETWICDACGKESSSDDWELKSVAPSGPSEEYSPDDNFTAVRQ